MNYFQLGIIYCGSVENNDEMCRISHIRNILVLAFITASSYVVHAGRSVVLSFPYFIGNVPSNHTSKYRWGFTDNLMTWHDDDDDIESKLFFSFMDWLCAHIPTHRHTHTQTHTRTYHPPSSSIVPNSMNKFIYSYMFTLTHVSHTFSYENDFALRSISDKSTLPYINVIRKSQSLPMLIIARRKHFRPPQSLSLVHHHHDLHRMINFLAEPIRINMELNSMPYRWGL